jgi:hypothetical protein
MKKKPITEVMAQLYVEEISRLEPTEPNWGELGPEEQARVMAAMAEVTRFFGLFGVELRVAEGKGFLAEIEEPDRSNVVRLPPSQEKVSSAHPVPENRPHFTGRMCVECGSLNTIPNGKCVLCMDCRATGECA